jgi:hypothetical protein
MFGRRKPSRPPPWRPKPPRSRRSSRGPRLVARAAIVATAAIPAALAAIVAHRVLVTGSAVVARAAVIAPAAVAAAPAAAIPAAAATPAAAPARTTAPAASGRRLRLRNRCDAEDDPSLRSSVTFLSLPPRRGRGRCRRTRSGGAPGCRLPPGSGPRSAHDGSRSGQVTGEGGGHPSISHGATVTKAGILAASPAFINVEPPAFPAPPRSRVDARPHLPVGTARADGRRTGDAPAVDCPSRPRATPPMPRSPRASPAGPPRGGRPASRRASGSPCSRRTAASTSRPTSRRRTPVSSWCRSTSARTPKGWRG